MTMLENNISSGADRSTLFFPHINTTGEQSMNQTTKEWTQTEVNQLLKELTPRQSKFLKMLSENIQVWQSEATSELGIEDGRAWGGFVASLKNKIRNYGENDRGLWCDRTNSAVSKNRFSCNETQRKLIENAIALQEVN